MLLARWRLRNSLSDVHSPVKRLGQRSPKLSFDTEVRDTERRWFDGTECGFIGA